MRIEKDAVKSFIYRIKEDINHVFKEVRTLSSQLGELSGLKTADKSNLVAAINEQNTNLLIKNTFREEWMPGFFVEGYGFMVQVSRLSKKHKMTITDVQIYHNAAWHSASPAVTERLNCWLIACSIPSDIGLLNGNVYLAKITGTIS